MRRLLTTRNVILVLALVLLLVSFLPIFRVPTPEVSVAAEPIFHLGPLAVTNSLFTAWVAMIVLIVLSAIATRRYRRDLSKASNQELVPSVFESSIEWIVEGFYRLTKDVAGSWADRFFPTVMTIFLFAIVSNWLGLIPGFGSLGVLEPVASGQTGLVAHGAILTSEEAQAGQGFLLVPLFRSPSTDLNFTIALALIAQVLAQVWGFKALGGGYARKFFDTSGFAHGAAVGVAQLFAGILELVSEVMKVISFSFRLFGNIFAGEVLLAVMAFLIPFVASLPFYGLEIFVGFIQAVVFMMLALVFFVTATIGHAHTQE